MAVFERDSVVEGTSCSSKLDCCLQMILERHSVVDTELSSLVSSFR